MKILFLEDRPDRQKLFLPNGSKDVELIQEIKELKMPEVNECKYIFEQLNEGKYVFESSVKLVVAHRSSLNGNGISYLNENCKTNQMKVIYFSGGLNQTTYNNDGFEQINLNSSDFYSDLLIPFLNEFIQDTDKTVLEVFNKNWKLSYMFLYQQLKANYEIETDDNGLLSPKQVLGNKIKQCENILGLDIVNDIEKNIEKLILKS
jgi:hypothetical protein